MRVLTIINDRAGGGPADVYDFIRALCLSGCEVTLRFAHEHQRAEDLAYDARDFDRVVAAGGDGTVGSVCYAMRNTDVPLLAYASGTANLLAANLGLPTDQLDLARLVMEGASASFDLGELVRVGADGREIRSGFAVMAGAGFDAAIMNAAQPLKPTLGAAAYFVGAVGHLAPSQARFELIVDGEPVSDEGTAVLAVNFARIQFDLPVTPNTNPQDGLLQVAVVRAKSVAELLPVVAAALMDRIGDHPDRTSAVGLYQGRHIEVRSTPALALQTDGDVLDQTDSFSVNALPGASRLIVPEGSPYLT